MLSPTGRDRETIHDRLLVAVSPNRNAHQGRPMCTLIRACRGRVSRHRRRPILQRDPSLAVSSACSALFKELESLFDGVVRNGGSRCPARALVPPALLRSARRLHHIAAALPLPRPREWEWKGGLRFPYRPFCIRLVYAMFCLYHCGKVNGLSSPLSRRLPHRAPNVGT